MARPAELFPHLRFLSQSPLRQPGRGGQVLPSGRNVELLGQHPPFASTVDPLDAGAFLGVTPRVLAEILAYVPPKVAVAVRGTGRWGYATVNTAVVHMPSMGASSVPEPLVQQLAALWERTDGSSTHALATLAMVQKVGQHMDLVRNGALIRATVLSTGAAIRLRGTWPFRHDPGTYSERYSLNFMAKGGPEHNHFHWNPRRRTVVHGNGQVDVGGHVVRNDFRNGRWYNEDVHGDWPLPGEEMDVILRVGADGYSAEVNGAPFPKFAFRAGSPRQVRFLALEWGSLQDVTLQFSHSRLLEEYVALAKQWAVEREGSGSNVSCGCTIS